MATRQFMAMRAAAYHLKGVPMTASNLGEMLWGRQARMPQHYARPAGKLLQEMKRIGVVTDSFDKYHHLWKLRIGWEKKLESELRPEPDSEGKGE